MLPDNLLTPISGENPSGKSLRYEPVYGKIKEARREELELPQGDWAREVKLADPAAVIKLATDALSKQSKDLQIAVWLTEALLRRDGFEGLLEGLTLLRSLVEQFWDTIYPEAEDGDVELRVAPLTWLGSYLGEVTRKVPLSSQGFDFWKYQESRAIGTEAACADNDAKTAAREAAIAEGKLTPEEFDKDVAATPRDFYVALADQIAACLEALESLDTLCREKAGQDSPSYTRLQEHLEEIQQVAKTLLKTKPDPSAARPQRAAAVAESGAPSDEPTAETPVEESVPATAPVLTGEPQDADDAVRRIVSGSNFLFREQPCNPASYLVLRGLRWGELRSGGPSPSPELLVAPSSETRQELKRLSMEGNWQELLSAAEAAMAQPSGRSWLDIQRHVLRACSEMGGDYDGVSRAIQTGVKGLLEDMPELLQATFLDDTPVANPETQSWFKELLAPPASPPQEAAEPEEELPAVPAPRVSVSSSESQPPDALDLALAAAQKGKISEAVEILTREISKERSGRARFERKTQLANLCLTTKHESIAYPILREMADEIERRKLDEWESPEVLAKPLVLLYRCLHKQGGDNGEKQKVYERICRLDPVQALACLK